MKLRYLAATGVAAALALTAFGSGGSYQFEAAGHGAGQGFSPLITVKPDAASKQGTAPLTIAKPDGAIKPENNNPWVSTDPAMTLGYVNAIYEPLAMVDLVGSAKTQMWLASKVSWSKDYRTVHVTARSGVKWSDGKAFTAADIAFTFNYLKKHPELDANALGIAKASSKGNVATITFKDSMYVRQDKVLMDTHIVPKHIWAKISNPSKNTNLHPVGTGPYALAHFSSQGVQLKARKGYWGGTPAVPVLNYVSYDSNTSLTTALAQHEADWAQAAIPNVTTAYVDKDKTHNHYWAAGDLADDVLFVNTTTAPFNNVAFRKALNMVINRPQYAKIARLGLIPSLTSATGLPTPAGNPFITKAYAKSTYKVDVAAAKKVLTSAGYTYQNGTLMDPSGSAVTFTLTDPSGWSDYDTGISLISKAAQSLGVTANVTTPDADSWTEAIGDGNFQAAEHWTDSGATAYNIFDDMMDGSWLEPIGTNANYNFGRFSDPTATKALQQYANATSSKQRSAALATVEREFMTKVPAMPLAMRPDIAEYDSKNYVGWPSAKNAYINPDPTQPSAVEILMRLKPGH
jgi:peptide/nickel transport system substrate-binding protein